SRRSKAGGQSRRACEASRSDLIGLTPPARCSEAGLCLIPAAPPCASRQDSAPGPPSFRSAGALDTMPDKRTDRARELLLLRPWLLPDGPSVHRRGQVPTRRDEVRKTIDS